jgi:lipopolysaccharide export system protein LptA
MSRRFRLPPARLDRARLACACLIGALVLPVAAGAQGAAVPFGGLSHDSSLPVEITADALELEQAAGTAIFIGGVRVGQGDLRMAADRIEVFYVDQEGTGTVERMLATGNVMLSNGTEAAESERAAYAVATGIVEMEGSVLLTQGRNALSSERLRIDLTSGTGRLEGRVQTIFMPGSAPGAASGEDPATTPAPSRGQ